jgi:hypothetical protein
VGRTGKVESQPTVDMQDVDENCMTALYFTAKEVTKMLDNFEKKTDLRTNAPVFEDHGNDSRRVEFDIDIDTLSKIDEEILSSESRFNEHVKAAAIFGIDAFFRAASKQDVDFISNQLNNVVNTTFDTIVDQIGTDEGQGLHSLIQSVETLQNTADEISSTVDVDSKTSPLSTALDGINNAIASINDIVGDEGVLKTTVNDALAPVLAASGMILAKADAESNTTKKGKSHEENVHVIVKKWAESKEGTAVHCGPDNKPGDHILSIPMPIGDNLRIVVESKDESTARGTKHISDRLEKSMTIRNCNHGIWITKDESGLSVVQIGDWGLGVTSSGNWLATTIDNIKPALIYVMAMEVIRREKTTKVTGLSSKTPEILDLTKGMQNDIKEVQNIKIEAGSIISSANSINQHADSIRNNIRNKADSLESIINAALATKEEE